MKMIKVIVVIMMKEDIDDEGTITEGSEENGSEENGSDDDENDDI